jgi:hypothetical protein
LKVEMFFHLLINMRMIFDFITMNWLITYLIGIQIDFLKMLLLFFTIFDYLDLYKWVKVDELLNIIHFQYNIALKCTCKISTFKYYRRIHQTSNEKIGLNSISLVIFKHTCYPFLLCQSFSNFVIAPLKTQRKTLYFYYVIFTLLSSTCVKNFPWK